MSGTDEQADKLIDAVVGDKGKTDDAPDKKADDTPKFTQADVDRFIADRLKRAQEQAKADRLKAEEAARVNALADEGKHKERADLLENRVKELEPLQAQLEKQLEDANAAVTAVLQHKLESVTLPTVVKNLLAEKSPAQQLALITEYEKEMGTSDKGGARVPGTPNGSTGRQLQSADQSKADANLTNLLGFRRR